MRSHIYHFVTCRKFRGKPAKQKIADLPEQRSIDAASFTYVFMNMFGLFVTK